MGNEVTITRETEIVLRRLRGRTKLSNEGILRIATVLLEEGLRGVEHKGGNPGWKTWPSEVTGEPLEVDNKTYKALCDIATAAGRSPSGVANEVVHMAEGMIGALKKLEAHMFPSVARLQENINRLGKVAA